MADQRFLPYGRHHIEDSDIQAVIDVLKSDFLTTGPKIDEFEARLLKLCGGKRAVVCNNGTTALHLAYAALDVGPGDAVIVPALTFAATSNAALYTGAKVVFADIDPKTKCLDAKSAAEACQIAKKAGLKPKVIAPVHFAGLPADLVPIKEVANEFGAKIVEDACHALGAGYRMGSGEMKTVGACTDTAIACFSFHPVKHVAMGEGGAVTTANSELGEKLASLRTHGITRDAKQYKNKERAQTNGEPNPWYHEMQALGFNYRLPDLLAALGTSQLNRIEKNIEQRRKIASLYRAKLKGTPNLTLPPDDHENGRHSYHLFAIDIDYKKLGKTRAQVMNQLKEKGVGTQVHYIPVCWHPFYENNRSHWLATKIPNAEAHYGSTLSIPMYHALTEADADRVVAGIRSTLGA